MSRTARSVGWPVRGLPVVALGALLLVATASGRAWASPDGESLSDFLEIRSLLREGQTLPPLNLYRTLLSCAQDDGTEWGWGSSDEGERGSAKEPEEREEPREAPETADDSAILDSEDWERRQAARDVFRRKKPEVVSAKRVRIGLEGGLFLPLGAREENFGTGGTGGAVFGFGLPTLVEGLTITSEIRVLAASTSSTGQDGGFDVSSTLFLVKKDFLFHFFPNDRSFNLFAFLGIGGGYESAVAEPESGGSGLQKETDSGVWFLAQGGLGSWINIGGPVDIVLKIEFNLIPTSENVPFFVTGGGGLQVGF